MILFYCRKFIKQCELINASQRLITYTYLLLILNFFLGLTTYSSGNTQVKINLIIPNVQ